MKFISNLIFQQSPETLMKRELTEAKRSLLEAQSAREYAISMVSYHQSRVDRLTKALQNETQHGQG